MGLIKWITLSKGKIKQERELKQEERLILREMAQERLNKKRALEQKQKEFDKMLDMRLPCANIIRLASNNPDCTKVNYYLMEAMPLTILLMLQEGVTNFSCKFKRLTGNDAGKIYNVNCPTPAHTPFYFCHLNGFDRSKLVVSILGYRNDKIEQHFGEKTELEKQYGKTISIRELLLLWKTDNRQMMDITIDNDYEMVKRLYDSEDILAESKNEELSK